MDIARMVMNVSMCMSKKTLNYRCVKITMLDFVRKAHGVERDTCVGSYANSTWPDSVLTGKNANTAYI